MRRRQRTGGGKARQITELLHLQAPPMWGGSKGWLTRNHADVAAHIIGIPRGAVCKHGCMLRAAAIGDTVGTRSERPRWAATTSAACTPPIGGQPQTPDCSNGTAHCHSAHRVCVEGPHAGAAGGGRARSRRARRARREKGALRAAAATVARRVAAADSTAGGQSPACSSYFGGGKGCGVVAS